MNNVSDSALLDASKDLQKGLFAASLGGNLFKIRIGRKSQGKSSGHRTILAYSKDVRMIFMYGFSKNERDNISSKELQFFKTMSKDYLALSEPQIERAKATGILVTLEETNAKHN